MRAVVGVRGRQPSARTSWFVSRRVLPPLTVVAVVAALAASGPVTAAPDPVPGSILADVKPLPLDGVDRSFVPALADPDLFTSDPAKGARLSQARADAAAKLEDAEQDWLEASGALEQASA